MNTVKMLNWKCNLDTVCYRLASQPGYPPITEEGTMLYSIWEMSWDSIKFVLPFNLFFSLKAAKQSTATTTHIVVCVQYSI
jgi:hypothetical protein